MTPVISDFDALSLLASISSQESLRVEPDVPTKFDSAVNIPCVLYGRLCTLMGFFVPAYARFVFFL